MAVSWLAAWGYVQAPVFIEIERKTACDKHTCVGRRLCSKLKVQGSVVARAWYESLLLHSLKQLPFSGPWRGGPTGCTLLGTICPGILEVVGLWILALGTVRSW